MLFVCVFVLSIGEMLNMKNFVDSMLLDEIVVEGFVWVFETVTMIKDVYVFGFEDKMVENYDVVILMMMVEE